MENNKKKTIFIFIGILIIAFGVILLTLTAVELFHGVQSNSWHYVIGKISDRSVRVVESRKGSEDETVSYFPKVSYVYSVNGTEYHGETIRFSRAGFRDPNGAKYMTDKYPPGSEAKVYYSTRNPNLSVLEPGWHGTTVFLIFLHFAIIFAGVYIIIYRGSMVFTSTSA